MATALIIEPLTFSHRFSPPQCHESASAFRHGRNAITDTVTIPTESQPRDALHDSRQDIAEQIETNEAYVIKDSWLATRALKGVLILSHDKGLVVTYFPPWALTL